MVGEPDGIDLAQVILDAAPTPRRTVEAVWMPNAEPGAVRLVRDAVLDALRRPAETAALMRQAIRDTQQTASRVASVAEGLASSVLSPVRRDTASPLHARIGEQRRIAIARTALADYRTVRAAFGGTVNDVVLAVVAGALRGWLVFRAQPLPAAAAVRALLPVGVIDPDDATRGRVQPLLVDLPVGEPDPVVRLAQLRYAMATHQASGRALGADRLAGLHGFAPPTLHALGVRAASGLARRMYSLVVTNMPGPQFPLYAAGARMTEMFPVLPLSEGQALSVGLTSYDGGVYFGINGDRDAVRDIATVADLIEESLAELVSAALSSRGVLRPSTIAHPRRARPGAPSDRKDRP
jgi:WS/DGAT/MGAT family acyltransferase